MKITFNKAAYQQKVPSVQEAADIYLRFIQTFMALEQDKRISGGTEFFGDTIDDISAEISEDGGRIYDLQKYWGTYGRTYFSKLLSHLTSISSGKRTPIPGKLFALDHISFWVPKDSAHSMLISLETSPRYTEPILLGTLEGTPTFSMSNISCKAHIIYHRVKLGIRLYERNPKHKDTYDSMGKGHVSSPMDLNDEDAQSLLNRAICIDSGRVLYATKDGKCYVFREHLPGQEIYHGYREDSPSEKVRLALKIS